VYYAFFEHLIYDFGRIIEVYYLPKYFEKILKVVQVVNEVGPLDLEGRELVPRMETSVKNNGQIFTDEELQAGICFPMVQR
jgi:hypothetical protein